MEQRIINAISVALDSVFPDIPHIDVETEQDVERPAFFITCTGSILTERITNAHFFMTYSFDILFDPGGREPELECRKVESELSILLRRIPDLESEYAFRPFGIHFETVDGMLHALFQIQESIKVDPKQEPKVESFTLNSKAEIIHE